MPASRRGRPRSTTGSSADYQSAMPASVPAYARRYNKDAAMRLLRKTTGWQLAAIALLLCGSFSAPAPAFDAGAPGAGPGWSAPESNDSLRPVPETHQISRAAAKGAGVRPISSGAAALPGGNG